MSEAQEGHAKKLEQALEEERERSQKAIETALEEERKQTASHIDELKVSTVCNNTIMYLHSRSEKWLHGF